mgnify:CR=1 FL=1
MPQLKMLTQALKNRLINQLKLHEGVEKFPYRDTVGKLTIGVGRNLTDVGLRDHEIDLLLDTDITLVVDEAEQYHWFEALTDNRKLVVVDMLFNLGKSRFEKFSKMITAIEAADWAEASEQMLSSRWARQVGGRATTLATMMLNG